MTNKQDIFTFVQVIGNIKKFNIKILYTYLSINTTDRSKDHENTTCQK